MFLFRNEKDMKATIRVGIKAYFYLFVETAWKKSERKQPQDGERFGKCPPRLVREINERWIAPTGEFKWKFYFNKQIIKVTI